MDGAQGSLLGTKVCSRCGVEKQPWEFRRDRGRPVLRSKCKLCVAIEKAAYCKANPEKEKSRHADYRKANAEKIADYRKANAEKIADYRKANAEKIKATKATYYKANSEKIAAFRNAHLEKIKAAQAILYKANRDKIAVRYKDNREQILAKQAAYYNANSGLVKDRVRAWRKENYDKVRANYHRRRARERAAGGSFTAADIKDIRTLQRSKCAHPWCRASLVKKKGHIDHIIPLAIGGTNHRRNLQLLCARCNLSKGAKHPVVVAQANGLLL